MLKCAAAADVPGEIRPRDRPTPWSAASTAEHQTWAVDPVERGELGGEAEVGADWRSHADRIPRRRG
jgi:hypothetical protein